MSERAELGIDGDCGFALLARITQEIIDAHEAGASLAHCTGLLESLLSETARPEGATTWIAVGEQMPPDQTYVLGYQATTGTIAVGMSMQRDDGIMWMFGASMGHESKFPHLRFTHWMPLPDRPRGPQKGEG